MNLEMETAFGSDEPQRSVCSDRSDEADGALEVRIPDMEGKGVGGKVWKPVQVGSC